MPRLTGLLGLAVFLALAFVFSTDRRAIRWRTVAWGLSLQVLFAFLVIKWSLGQRILYSAGAVITSLLAHSVDGSSLVFGPLGTPGNPLAVLAFAVLPTIIFVSAFFAVLYHIGFMQRVIRVVAWIMFRTMGTSGAESTNVAASIFMGQTEAPLTIRPFLAEATRSELMTIMTSGMAHVSGGIMAAYIAFGIHAQDLLSAVIMTAPGTILVAKMLVPETGQPATAGVVHMPPDEHHSDENLLGAVARGTLDGGRLAFNVAIMLISFLALVGLANAIHARRISIHALGHPPSRHQHTAFPSRTRSTASSASSAPPSPGSSAFPGTRPPPSAISSEPAPCSTSSSPSSSSAPSAPPSPPAASPSPPSPSAASPISAPSACRSAASAPSFPTRRNDLARLGLRAMLAGTMANLMSASIVSLLHALVS